MTRRILQALQKMIKAIPTEAVICIIVLSEPRCLAIIAVTLLSELKLRATLFESDVQLESKTLEMNV